MSPSSTRPPATFTTPSPPHQLFPAAAAESPIETWLAMFGNAATAVDHADHTPWAVPRRTCGAESRLRHCMATVRSVVLGMAAVTLCVAGTPSETAAVSTREPAAAYSASRAPDRAPFRWAKRYWSRGKAPAAAAQGCRSAST